MAARADDGPAVFAQPWWLRGMNIVAALAVALIPAAAVMNSSLTRPPAVTLSLLLAAAGLWIGVRAALSCVTLSPVALRYRGIFKSWTVPTSSVLALTDGGTGVWSLLTNRNGPSLSWRASGDEVRSITLACLPTAKRYAIGSGATQVLTEDLRLALEPYIRANT